MSHSLDRPGPLASWWACSISSGRVIAATIARFTRLALIVEEVQVHVPGDLRTLRLATS
jgi:hypothetical protein